MRRPVTVPKSDNEYKKGHFREYRATMGFSFGSVEHLKLELGDIVEFDGNTLRVGEDEYSIRQARGAIERNWLVPVEDEDTVYVPEPAGIVMAPADTTKTKKGHVVDRAAMASDEIIVGSRQDVRQAATAPRRPRQKIGHAEVLDEGIVIGKVNTPAITRTELDRQNVGVKQQKAAGSADPGKRSVIYDRELESLIPDAASAGDHYQDMTEEEYLAYEEKKERQRLAALQAEARRRSRASEDLEIGENEVTDPRQLVKERVAVQEPEEVEEEAASNIVRTSKGVDWDVSNPSHWASRAKEAIDRFGWSADILESIAEVESAAVAKRIRSHIEKM